MAGTQFSLRALLIATSLAAVGAAMVARSGPYGAATSCTFGACALIVSLWRTSALSYRGVFCIGLVDVTGLAAIALYYQFFQNEAALCELIAVTHLAERWGESLEVIILLASARAAAIFSGAYATLYLVSTGADQNGWRRGAAIALGAIIALMPAQHSLASLQRIADPAFWPGFWEINSLSDGLRVIDMHAAILAVQVLGGASYLYHLARRRPIEAMAIGTILLLFNSWAAAVWLDPMNAYL